MRYFFIFVLLISILLPGGAFAAQAEVEQAYFEGTALYQEGRYKEAEGKFAEAAAISPRHVQSLFMLGESIGHDVRRLREAENWYRKALNAATGRDKFYAAKSRFSLGVLYEGMGQYDQSREQFLKLIDESPGFMGIAKVYNHMGVADYHLDRYDEALDNFKRALKLDPNLTEATFNMKSLQSQLAMLNVARYQERMGNEQNAVEQYNKAIEVFPDYVAAWYYLGVLYLKKADYAQAVRYLTRAKDLNPQYLGGDELPYQIALALSGRKGAGDQEMATKLLMGRPEYKDALLKAGMVRADQGFIDQAENIFTQVTEKSEQTKALAEAWYQLGLIAKMKNDGQKASACIQKAASLAPNEARYKSK
jgi:tetratricopeptide (TPR) repeat protein